MTIDAFDGPISKAASLDRSAARPVQSPGADMSSLTVSAPAISGRPLPAAELRESPLRCPDLWRELRGARVFLTGGSGFFGRWLVESLLLADQLLALRAQVVLLTRSPEALQRAAPHLFADPRVVPWPGDVRDFTPPDGEFSHMIHGATSASARLNAEQPLEMLDTILHGTRRCLELAVRRCAGPLLFISSGAVYGRQPPDCARLPEDAPGAPSPLDPLGAYAHGKRLGEHLCALFHHQHGVQVKLARPFAFVGPLLPLDSHFAAGNFLRDGLAGGPIRVTGDGSPCRSYLYASDLAEWLWTILLRGQPGRPYNVGSPHAVTLAELAGLCGEIFGAPVQIARPPQDRPAERYVPDTRRAADELGLTVRVDLPEALRRTARWHQERS